MKNKRYVLHNYWPIYCCAHGDADWEHYEVQYYDMIRKKKIIKRNFCEAGCCTNLPFDFEKEVELFDSLGLLDYWRACGVSEELIIKACEN